MNEMRKAGNAPIPRAHGEREADGAIVSREPRPDSPWRGTELARESPRASSLGSMRPDVAAGAHSAVHEKRVLNEAPKALDLKRQKGTH